jgi:hypothetical protein
MSKMPENQLTVPLSEPLREYLEQAAAREHRSVESESFRQALYPSSASRLVLPTPRRLLQQELQRRVTR